MTESARTIILLAAALGCLIYAFIPPGNPQWIGTAGALFGGEALARARPKDDD